MQIYRKQISIDLFPIRTVRKTELFSFLSIAKIQPLARDTSSTSHNTDEMLVSAQSRLKSDFEVIGTIGRGGFGHVFKVKINTDIEISSPIMNNLGAK